MFHGGKNKINNKKHMKVVLNHESNEDFILSRNDQTVGLFDAATMDGGPYDVSLHFPNGGINGGHTYTFDSAVVRVPEDLRRGGMSIKYINTSDIYEQYRLTKDEWSTTQSDWTSVDNALAEEITRAQAAEANRYTKAETYSKAQLDNLITTPNVNYVVVSDYASLPSTGAADTIYRVSSYDGAQSQVNVACYSEYAWNGTAYQLLAVKSQVDEVFDISAYRATSGVLAKYDNLSAALDGGNNVPQSLRKGGMSIKFVQSSDNKYVQYRLMANTFSTTEGDWQGVDDDILEDSKNIPTGGGVVGYIRNLGISKVQDDTLYVVDSNGYIILQINTSGIKVADVLFSDSSLKDILSELEQRIDNLPGISQAYNDKFYIVDSNGYIIAKISNDGILVKNIRTESVKNLNGENLIRDLSNYELFSIGDSLSTHGYWQTKVCDILKCTFDNSKNIKAGSHLSTGGTITFGDGFDNAVWRVKNLIDEEYIIGDGENALIIFENINDLMTIDADYTFDPSALTIIPTTPIEGYDFSNWGTSLLNDISQEQRKLNAVLKLEYTTSGKNLAITTLPSSDGSVSLTIATSGGGTNVYNIQVLGTDTLQDILDKILEINYTALTDTLADNQTSVNFAGRSSITITFNDTGNTGMTVSITDTSDAKSSKAAYFIGQSLTDWADTAKWLMGSDLTFSSGYKSCIEMIQREYPKAHIIIGMFPFHMATQSEYLLSNGLYDTASYYNTNRMQRMLTLNQVLKDVADFYSIPFVNIVENWGVSISNLTPYYNAVANVHPTVIGYERIGESVAALINQKLI